MRPVIFAAGLDWLEGLLPLLFVLFWIVSQVVNVFRNVAGRGQPRQQPPVEQVRRPRPEDEPVETVRADLERQIEEFLTQRAEQRGQPVPGPVRMPPRPQTPPRLQPARAKTEKPRPATPPSRGEPVIAETITKTRSLPPSASQLGSLGSHGGDIARHVRDAFADDLGHRPSRLTQPAAAAEPAATRPAAAHDLVTLLRDPTALRQLFIVREVLDRPIDRWS